MENTGLYKFTIEETEYKTQLTQKFINRKIWQKPDPKEIYSRMPGTVLKINIKKGSKVKKDEVMFIIESMKMKTRILAPFEAKIKNLYLTEGQKIPKGYLLVEME